MQCMVPGNIGCKYHVMGGGRKGHRKNAIVLLSKFRSSQ